MPATQVSDAVLRGLVGGAALVIIVAGMRTAATLLVPLAIAGFLALISYPLVAWMQQRHFPKWTAVTLTVLALVMTLLGPGLVVQNAAVQFVTAAPRYEARLSEMTLEWFKWLQSRGLDASRVADVLNWTAALDLAGNLFTNIAFLLSNIVLVLLVVAFILVEAAGFPAKLSKAFMIDAMALSRFHLMTADVQRYLRVKTAVSLITGLLVWFWTALFQVDFAVLWGLLAFLLNYIPYFGSIMAAVPAVLLSLVQAGPAEASLVAAGLIAINIVLGHLIEPYVTGRQLHISPLVVVLMLVFWGWVWGPVGMVLAVPITTTVRILLEHSQDLRWVAVLIAGNESPPPEPHVEAEVSATRLQSP